MMAEKLGLAGSASQNHGELVAELLAILQDTETDMTIFFRGLSGMDVSPDATDEALLAPFEPAYYPPASVTQAQRQRTLQWARRYTATLRAAATGDEERRARMLRVNPKYVLRNYLAQLAIDRAEQGHFDLVNELLDVLRHPYEEQPLKENFAARRPDWARQRPGCSMLSCSS
jgi:uncharacterized protein YdiU (UPF0061 family)